MWTRGCRDEGWSTYHGAICVKQAGEIARKANAGLSLFFFVFFFFFVDEKPLVFLKYCSFFWVTVYPRYLFPRTPRA